MKTGIDIVSIKRIEAAAKNSHFLRRVFTDREIEHSFKKRFPYRHLAGRFAAKEALIKALSGASAVAWKDMEVVNGEDGRPALTIHSKDALYEMAHLSISYTMDLAAAIVVIE